MKEPSKKTFLTLPEDFRQPETARYLVWPIPYEGTVCFLDGTARGPDAILDVSDQMEHFDEELRIDFTRFGIATLPSLESAETPEQQSENIYRSAVESRIFDPISSFGKSFRRFPIILGGEHGITPPVVRYAAEVFENLSVLQFDAHADLRESFTGSRFSHASAMKRVLDYTPHLAQVGVRSYSAEEYRDHSERIHRIVTPALLAQDYAYSIDRILYSLTENVYITIDIDAFDPSFAPGTGTPEPGGLHWQQVIGILRKVCFSKNVVGADIVEVAPLGGHNVITEFLAARLAAKLMAYTQPS